MKDLIENNNYVVVLDTNVLLNVYRYSPEFSEFALNCLKAVKDYVMLPATVRLEYEKHYRAQFAKMQGRVKNAGKETSEQIQRTTRKVLAVCNNLERLQFPDIEELREGLSQKLDELQEVLEDFFYERSSLNLVSHSWDSKDYLMNLVGEWDNTERIMPSPSQKDIYNWCEEAESRYSKNIPPGFKDNKKKDGIKKYSDLILWEEVIRYAAAKKKNIVFVTDDVKADWWEKGGGNKQFHQKLIDEFEKTGQHIYPCISKDFYDKVSQAYFVEKTDVVELALRMTDKDYCRKISEKVFDEVFYDIAYSNTDYIDTFSSHVGSEGIDELDIVDHELLSAERVDRNDNEVTYQFEYKVKLEGTSYEYWGRDEDTKEIIRSLGTDHIFEGIIVVEVTREADIYLDFEDDNGYETVEIVHGDLKEIDYNERWEEPELEYGELGNCPDCGCPLTIENDSGGFCIQCAANH